MVQNLHFTNEVMPTLRRLAEQQPHNRVVCIADTNTCHLLPSLDCPVIAIPAGEDNKTLATVGMVWDRLHELGVTRNSLVINLGGGVVTDLGGFAAATFKRGLRFINVPTTLLGAVDAAVGGKTGFNHQGLKNQIGAFAPASDVVISTCFFDTLPKQELKSGFAEVLKHALLSSHEQVLSLLNHDFSAPINHEALLQQLRAAVEVKQDIVARDPNERGERKALNLGHTVGHAIEALALSHAHPVPHGYAVAWGLVAECALAGMRLHFPSSDLYRLAGFIRENYGVTGITCNDYDALIDAMRHDKKSADGEINCTLLAACGDYRVGQVVTPDEMRTALDLMRDLLGE